MTTCTTMRTAAILSTSLLFAGILLLAVAETAGLAMALTHLALGLVMAAAATLAVAFLIAIWPGNAARLSECLH